MATHKISWHKTQISKYLRYKHDTVSDLSQWIFSKSFDFWTLEPNNWVEIQNFKSGIKERVSCNFEYELGYKTTSLWLNKTNLGLNKTNPNEAENKSS